VIRYLSAYGLLGALFLGMGAGLLHAQASPRPTVPRYVLPGDFVRVAFSMERELGGDFAVDDAGEVLLPLLGVVSVTDVPTDSLRGQIRRAFALEVKNQAVQVQFLHRVSVLGSVAQPGLYHADGTMTIQDVLALAGGVRDDGKRDLVEIQRRGNEQRSQVSPTALVLEVVRSGDQLSVPQRSWLSRHSAAVFGGVVSAIAIVASRAAYR